MRRIVIILMGIGLAACAGNNGGAPATTNPVLIDPSAAAFQAEPPDTFLARFETTTGSFDVEVIKAWAPQGAKRFYNLVRNGYYDGNRFFRVLPGFMAQTGLHGNPPVNEAWRRSTIPDDPVQQTNGRGMVSFATSGPDSRTTQFFINFGDNANLDAMGFAPFGRVRDGMEAVDGLYAGYGEGAPSGTGPDQNLIRSRGNEYLGEMFPRLDYIERATIVE
jgi:peptidyl-prolyl cis-trans isomerase A (cyclophilin A)